MKKSESGKKQWSRPELTVLTRNRPEEAVLNGCKVEDLNGPGANNCTSDITEGPCDNLFSS
jgi:hypothetical protein